MPYQETQDETIFQIYFGCAKGKFGVCRNLYKNIKSRLLNWMRPHLKFSLSLQRGN